WRLHRLGPSLWWRRPWRGRTRLTPLPIKDCKILLQFGSAHSDDGNVKLSQMLGELGTAHTRQLRRLAQRNQLLVKEVHGQRYRDALAHKDLTEWHGDEHRRTVFGDHREPAIFGRTD